MSQLIYKGRIDGEFQGFDNEVLFKLRNGTYWIQTRYKYWYKYAYCPEVTITKEDGKFFLNVADKSIQVTPISDVIKSNIKGAFKGCDGNSVYELVNGQIWQQSMYKYEYQYAYSPEVTIYPTSGGYTMRVAGMSIPVRRTR